MCYLSFSVRTAVLYLLHGSPAIIPAGHRRGRLWTKAVIQIQPQSSHHVEIPDREETPEKQRCSCSFCFRIIERQVIVVACLSPFECLSDFKPVDPRRIAGVHYWQSNLLGDERRWSRKQQSSGFVERPGLQSVSAETGEGVEGSYSLLKAPTQEQVTHMANAWRRHLTHICTWIRKHLCVHTQKTFVLSHMHMRVCARSCKTKLAVCYSQAVETDLPQCLHCLMRGEEYKKRCSTVRQGDLPSIENQWRKISTHTDVAVVQVHLLYACCTNGEQLQKPKRNRWRRDCREESCCHPSEL